MSQLVRRYVQYKNRNKARIDTYFPPMIRCSDFVTYTIYTNSFIFTKSVKELWIFFKTAMFFNPCKFMHSYLKAILIENDASPLSKTFQVSVISCTVKVGPYNSALIIELFCI